MGAPPLTPPNCDLSNFPRVQIDIARLRNSQFDLIENSTAWRAGMNLILACWHQVPAASLPDDDRALARLTGLGLSTSRWKKLKAAALTGWELCDDGRYYHRDTAERALHVWLEKLHHSKVGLRAAGARWGTSPADRVEDQIQEALKYLEALAPEAPMIRKLQSRPGQIADADALPMQSQEKEKEKEREKEKGTLERAQQQAYRQSRSGPFPDNFEPNEETVTFANGRGFRGRSLDEEMRKFENHHRAKGEGRADWQAAARYWLGRAKPAKPPDLGFV